MVGRETFVAALEQTKRDVGARARALLDDKWYSRKHSITYSLNQSFRDRLLK